LKPNFSEGHAVEEAFHLLEPFFALFNVCFYILGRIRNPCCTSATPEELV